MKFSIVIPVFKYSSFLDDCLISCFEQSFRDFEIVVIDDGSPTELLSQVKRIFENNTSRVKYKCQRIPNSGSGVARNYGASLSEGEYLVFLDGDDLLHRDALKHYNIALDKAPNGVLVSQRCEFRNVNDILHSYDAVENGNVLVYNFKCYFEKEVNFRFGASNIVVPKYEFFKVGGFRSRTQKTSHAEDHDLLLKLGGLKFSYIERPYLVYYRLHENNSIRDVKKIAFGVLDLISSNENGDYPGGKLYVRQRYEIIGAPTFHVFSKLLKKYSIVLATSVLFRGYKYIIFHILSKIGPNAKRKSI